MAKKDLSAKQRLVKYGFIKTDSRHLYRFNDKKKVFEPVKGEINGDDADMEVAEEINVSPALGSGNQYLETGFPRPFKRYRLIMEAFNQSVEEPYFWVLGHMRQDLAFHKVDKITDIFSASENSAFFGQSAQRLGIQQDRASQYLATIGKLTRDFFPMVRELRILDERLDLYTKWDLKQESPKSSKAADVTLKGVFIDFAEGGSKNPSSVYGLSQQVGFTILPDLFFNTVVYDENKVDTVVDAMAWNPQVKNILKRKLYQYIIWVKRTKEELVNRKKFTLKYLRQHWAIVKMYISWIKPYLRTAKRLAMNETQLESPDLIGAFETSMTEIEILARKPGAGPFEQVLLATFNYRTKPTMQYRQEYQQGPIHVGRVQFDVRAYGWTKEQIEGYKKMKQDEEIEMLGIVDSSLKEAMDAFGEEIQTYLEQAGEPLEKPEEPEKKPEKLKGSGIADPFVALVGGFGEMFGSLIPISGGGGKKSKTQINWEDSDKVGKMSEFSAFMVYKNFKTSHGMISP